MTVAFELSNLLKEQGDPPPFPLGPGKTGGPRLDLSEGGDELRVELAAGALGLVGHDRLRWSDRVEPCLALAIDVLADARRRRRGEGLAEVVSLEARGLFTLQVVPAQDSTVILVWLAPALRRWARSKGMGLTETWELVVSRLVWVVGADGALHPTWAALAKLDLSGLEGRR